MTTSATATSAPPVRNSGSGKKIYRVPRPLVDRNGMMRYRASKLDCQGYTLYSFGDPAATGSIGVATRRGTDCGSTVLLGHFGLGALDLKFFSGTALVLLPFSRCMISGGVKGL
jgi:hypothetical protein